MRTRFWKCTIIVTAAHILVLAALFAFSILPNPLETPVETAITVAYAVEPAPLQLEAPAEIVETPAVPEIPEEKPHSTIERSGKRIRRVVPNEQRNLSLAETKKRLAIDTPPKAERAPDPDSRYMELIRGALYSAWLQPSSEAVGEETATAEIKFASNGNIVSWRLTRASGIEEMDGSVLRALNAVKQVNGLPASFLSRHGQVTILFKVEG